MIQAPLSCDENLFRGCAERCSGQGCGHYRFQGQVTQVESCTVMLEDNNVACMNCSTRRGMPKYILHGIGESHCRRVQTSCTHNGCLKNNGSITVNCTKSMANRPIWGIGHALPMQILSKWLSGTAAGGFSLDVDF